MTPQQQYNLEQARKAVLEDLDYMGDPTIFIPGEVPSNKSLGQPVHVEYIEATEIYYANFRLKFLKLAKNKKKPLKVKFTFIRRDLKRFRYITAAQIVQDLMFRHAWLEDDSADFLVPYFEEYQVDKYNPGVIIEVLN